MTTKTHLVQQEYNVTESGVQIRQSDPTYPADSQIWLNTEQKRIKARLGEETYVIARGGAFSRELLDDTVIDMSELEACQKRASEDVTLSLINGVPGRRLHVSISNIGVNEITFSFEKDGAILYAENFVSTLQSGQRALCTILVLDGYTLISSEIFE